MDLVHDSATKIEEGDVNKAIANFREIGKGWTESFQQIAANRDGKLMLEAHLPTECHKE